MTANLYEPVLLIFVADSMFENIENKKATSYMIAKMCSMGNIKTGISLMQT